MRHLMLAITLVALIAYSTTITGCKSSGTPTAPGPSDRAAHSGRDGNSRGGGGIGASGGR
jgi:hypothetical protein